MLVLTATAAGDTTSLIDNQNLWMPNSALKNRVMYFTHGTDDNLGLKRIATGNAQATTSVTWNLALPAATAQGDVCEMWNTRGTGFDPVQEVNAILNDVIRAAIDYAWVLDTEDMGTFDIDTGYLAIPEGTRAFYAIEYQDRYETSIWHEIPRGRDIGRPGWDYERGANIVWIRGPWATSADGQTVRMRRYTDDAVLTDDADTIDLPLDFLVATTTRKLYGASFDRAPNERMLPQRYQDAGNDALARRAALGRRLMPDTVVCH